MIIVERLSEYLPSKVRYVGRYGVLHTRTRTHARRFGLSPNLTNSVACTWHRDGWMADDDRIMQGHNPARYLKRGSSQL